MSSETSMQAVVYESSGVVTLGSLPIPKPEPGDVIVRVAASGVCHTDIDVLHGRYGTGTFPLVPGHEFVGEVVETGDGVTSAKVGDRVAVDPNIHCGRCRQCQRGQYNLCDELGAYGVTRHGGFADHCVIAESAAIPNGDMSYPVAALAEPLGCTLTGLSAMDGLTNENALIFGAGPIGLLMALALKARGVEDVSVADIADHRLDLASSLGFTPIRSSEDALQPYRRGFDFVADATGVPKVAEGLIDYTVNGGGALFFGVCPPESRISISPFEVFRRQIRLAGTHSLNHNIPEALETLKMIGEPAEKLISHTLPLHEIPAFLEGKGAEQTLKVQAIRA